MENRKQPQDHQVSDISHIMFHNIHGFKEQKPPNLKLRKRALSDMFPKHHMHTEHRFPEGWIKGGSPVHMNMTNIKLRGCESSQDRNHSQDCSMQLALWQEDS